MKSLKFSIAFIFVSLFCYGQTTKKSNKAINSNQVILSLDKELDYILFGIFCGECVGKCATMYKYNMMGNSKALFSDSTDSYFKNYGNVVCNIEITDSNKVNTARTIVRQIPNQLLTTKNLTETFGCPDCTDGCGIYFELRQNNMVKKFYIDYSTSELPKGIKDFGEMLKNTIGILSN